MRFRFGRNFAELTLEAMLVVVGVIAAFGAENYREYRQELQMERDYLTHLKAELVSDTSTIAHELRSTSQQIQAFNKMLELIDTSDTLASEEFDQLIEMIFVDRALTFSRATFEEMKYSGNLRLIQNEKLKQNIVSYYIFTEKFTELVERVAPFVKGKYVLSDPIAFDEWTFVKPFSQEEILKKYRENPEVAIEIRRLLKSIDLINRSMIYQVFPRTMDILLKVNQELAKNPD